VVILALDVGEARIGVAVSDPSATLASPRGLIRRHSNAQALAAVAREVAAVGAELIVVGLPLSLDGVVREQARRVQRFGERLRSQVAVPVVYQDERLSTVTAAEALRAAGVRPDRIKERLDAAAAAVILRDYLDQHPADPAPTA
jgi:putative Holliday junction resolvase